MSFRIESAGELRQRQPRQRDEKHLAFIRKLPCAARHGACSGAVEAAHLRAGALAWGKRPVGVAEKPDDAWTLPLCHHHHLHGQHAAGNEVAWWSKQGRDPFRLAWELHEASGDLESGRLIVEGKLSGKVPF